MSELSKMPRRRVVFSCYILFIALVIFDIAMNVIFLKQGEKWKSLYVQSMVCIDEICNDFPETREKISSVDVTGSLKKAFVNTEGFTAVTVLNMGTLIFALILMTILYKRSPASGPAPGSGREGQASEGHALHAATDAPPA